MSNYGARISRARSELNQLERERKYLEDQTNNLERHAQQAINSCEGESKDAIQSQTSAQIIGYRNEAERMRRTGETLRRYIERLIEQQRQELERLEQQRQAALLEK